ncbi:MAG: hypothetical protein DRJ69_00210 [Thermoprotei archaeon]|nr:MAG: hypothetical protein DRJ69_00210 [Thermoprotei archaeon]
MAEIAKHRARPAKTRSLPTCRYAMGAARPIKWRSFLAASFLTLASPPTSSSLLDSLDDF